MTRARSTEEPCAAKVARTVLKTSGGSDPLAEFNRALRHAVQWRKTSYGTDSAGGSRFVEHILTVVTTCRQQQRNVLAYLTACCQAHYAGTVPPSLLPQTAR
jgi:hypothetical protein